jgi:hypothetical protein
MSHYLEKKRQKTPQKSAGGVVKVKALCLNSSTAKNKKARKKRCLAQVVRVPTQEVQGLEYRPPVTPHKNKRTKQNKKTQTKRLEIWLK